MLSLPNSAELQKNIELYHSLWTSCETPEEFIRLVAGDITRTQTEVREYRDMVKELLTWKEKKAIDPKGR